MDCPYCDHSKTHKHGKTSKGSQRYKCASCRKTFVETFDTLYYWRQVTPEEVDRILQSKAEGSSLRGISRINNRAYNTVVSVIHDAGYRAQLVHNEEVKDVETDEIVADEMWSFVKKSRSDVDLRT